MSRRKLSGANCSPYQVMWALSDHERAAAKTDIAAKRYSAGGVRRSRNILDGHHRVRAAMELRAEDQAKYGPLTWVRKVRSA